MWLWDLFKSSIRKEDPSNWIPDLNYEGDSAQRAYLKTMAKDTVINFVARTMSTLEVDIQNKDGTDWEYILNVRPNSDQTAADFWQAFFYRLIDENEVLVIKTDDDQLLIADDFNRTEYAVFDDRFDSVTYKNYTFNRTFEMSEVIYMNYNNEKLDRWTKGLFADYAELFGRILEVSMRNNQIRGSVAIEATGTLANQKDDTGRTKAQRLQEYIDKIYNSFRTKSVAIVPKMKGFEYEEYTNKQGVSNQSLDELNKLKVTLIDDVANMIGVPTALIYGEKSELKDNMDAMRKLCTNSLIKKVKDELTAKLIEKKDYQKGVRIEIRGVMRRDPLELADNIDKLISSTVFTGNMVLQELGYPKSDDPEMDKRLMTKNLTKLKGGGASDET
ncbi:phage portal protein [Enterococcus dispar]|uniref:HK97 family phage portal protein n=1 Tax=Enterococcus dispar ATCC 51266 TaxID=1139219 RepID=S1NXC3_9ENTE|nr:phage portal protein [Enterococcus dispar]EOT43804.1 HK97 family phage portal protein [Enterococcus dispar ATCC 51266]EOW85524.1 HK97 family phage portal protein [Enterococcus dispar ATCC 51266]